MKEFHCKYDSEILINYDTGKKPHYGPRLVNCSEHYKCRKCGWNPAVEAERKSQGLEIRNGYVNIEDGREIISDGRHKYRGIIIK